MCASRGESKEKAKILKDHFSPETTEEKQTMKLEGE